MGLMFPMLGGWVVGFLTISPPPIELEECPLCLGVGEVLDPWPTRLPGDRDMVPCWKCEGGLT